MCFPGPSKNDFLRSRDRFRTPKSRRIEFLGSFLAPHWIFWGLQNRPKSTKWRQKGVARMKDGATFWRFGTELSFESLLGTILVDLWSLVGSFWGDI